MSEFNGYAEHYAIGRAMMTYGGSFMEYLGQALQCADGENQRKIKETWPEEWQRYRNMAVQMYQVKS